MRLNLHPDNLSNMGRDNRVWRGVYRITRWLIAQPNSLNSDKVKVNLKRGLRKLLDQEKLVHAQRWNPVCRFFRKGEVGDRRLHWFETIPAMSAFLIFKKRTTKADCMSGHILALRVIHFKIAMENNIYW